jgi:hypothetical protein
VARLEADARRTVPTLREEASCAPWTEGDRRQRSQTLRLILGHEARVREYAEPPWISVDQWLHPSREG